MPRRFTSTMTWFEGLQRPARYLTALGVVLVASGAAETMFRLSGSSRVAGIFLAGVMVAAYLVGSGPGYFAAAISFGIYNFYVADPRFTFDDHTPEDWIVLGAFAAVAVLMGNLTGRLRDEAKRSRARARATAVLFEATREFSASNDAGLIQARLAEHLAAAVRGQAFALDAEAVCAAGGEPPPPTVLSAARARLGEVAGGPRHREAAGWRTWAMADGGIAGWRADRPLDDDEEALPRILADAGSGAIARAQLAVAKAEAEGRARTEDLRNALLSSISHDLRTPLAAVLASATSLQEFGDRFDATTRSDLIATIQEEAERLNTFVTNLLNMTRLESGALDAPSAAFDLAEVVGRVRRRFEKLYGRRSIACTLGADAGVAMGDPVLFEVALANVMENAVRYSPEGGAIAVSSARRGAQVVVQVTDEGPGVLEAELGKLFDKFYRGSGARRTPGTGLGLSIVRGVMQGMGGQAHAELRADAPSGLVVSLSLPAAAA